MKSGETMSKLGERIKKARELNNLSQTELAALIEIKSPSSGIISNRGRDLNKPDIEKIFKLCNVLKISLSYLLNWYGDSEFQITFTVQSLIKKYSSLDSHVKEDINNLLEVEYEHFIRGWIRTLQYHYLRKHVNIYHKAYYAVGASECNGEYLFDYLDCTATSLPEIHL